MLCLLLYFHFFAISSPPLSCLVVRGEVGACYGGVLVDGIPVLWLRHLNTFKMQTNIARSGWSFIWVVHFLFCSVFIIITIIIVITYYNCSYTSILVPDQLFNSVTFNLCPFWLACTGALDFTFRDLYQCSSHNQQKVVSYLAICKVCKC